MAQTGNTNTHDQPIEDFICTCGHDVSRHYERGSHCAKDGCLCEEFRSKSEHGVRALLITLSAMGAWELFG